MNFLVKFSMIYSGEKFEMLQWSGATIACNPIVMPKYKDQNVKEYTPGVC